MLGAKDVAERSVGPTVRTSLTLLNAAFVSLTEVPNCQSSYLRGGVFPSSHDGESRAFLVCSIPSLPQGGQTPPASHLAELLGTLKMPLRAYMQAAPAPLLKTGSVPCGRQPLRACHEGMAPPCHVIWDNAPNIATKRVLVPPAPQGEGRTELCGARPASW